MFTAFARFADGRIEKFLSIEQLVKTWSGDDGIVWIDLDSPTGEEIKALDQFIDLDDSALEDCVQGDLRPRIDEFENYIFLVFYGLMNVDAEMEAIPRKLAMFCGARFLITIHYETLKVITKIRDRVEKHAQHVFDRRIDYLLYTIIDMITENYLKVVDGYNDRIDELEGQSLEPTPDDSLLTDLSILRRELVEIRRVAASQKELLTPLAKGEFDYVSDSLSHRFSHIRDHFTQIVELVDSMRERLYGIRENHKSALVHKTNQIMQSLTAFNVILLPITLIASIYGMNFNNTWPSENHPLSFYGVVFIMFCIGGGSFCFFKRKKWL